MAQELTTNLTTEEINRTDITRAFDAIQAKRLPYTVLYEYYDGFQPLKYTAERLKKAFKSLNVYFAQNWCGVVIDSITDRLTFTGWDVKDKEAMKKLTDLFKDLRLAEDSDDINIASSVTGEAFFIAWKDANEIDAYFNDPRMCHMFYMGDSPKQKEFAAKMWIDESDKKPRINLYYMDRIEHWKADKEKPQSAKAFTPDGEPEKNPYGEIPVFHFKVNRRKYQGDLTPSILSEQDAINKLLSDMMVSAEFSQMIQRVILTTAAVQDLPNGAGINWNIPDVEAKVLELGGKADSLDSFLKAIDKLANSIAVQSKTPKHYFIETGTGSNVSGDALIAMESPLNKKAQKRKDVFSPVWVEIGNFLLTLAGTPLGEDDRRSMVPVWARVESVQPKATADIRKTNTEAGIPIVTTLRWEGKSQEEIKQMEDDQADERKRASSLGSNALDQIRAQNAATNADGETQVPA